MNTTRAPLRAIVLLIFAVLAVSVTATAFAQSRSVRQDAQRRVPPPAPALAIVALKEQRISIYDTTGAKMMEAPVSTGKKGYETPAGIYSVVQKKEEHYSNLYDDASMPFMQRITWTGIALHTGVLPGYPASHGCVRMPSNFAERLFGITKMGVRVVVVREDMKPVEIAEPALFKAKANTSVPQLPDLTAVAKAKIAEAAEATKKEKEARLNASRKAAEATRAERSLRAAEARLASAETDVKNAERALEKANSPARISQAEEAKAKAIARVDAARAQLDTARAEAQPKTDAAAQAQSEAQAAASEMNLAIGAANEAKRNLSPVSVLISRKTQRLYIRKNNYPLFEAPVIIRNADEAIGTFVFTALDRVEETGEMRWSVVSMYKNPTAIEPFNPAQHGPSAKARRGEPALTDVAAVQAALDRLDLPQEALDRISSVVLPGASLIISDEAPSVETGKDTDFVLFMSGEPQGGIAIRRREPVAQSNWNDDVFDSPPRYTRPQRSGGGFLFFFPDD